MNELRRRILLDNKNTSEKFPPGTRALWRFDENLYDSSGNDFYNKLLADSGTLTPVYVEGVYNKAAANSSSNAAMTSNSAYMVSNPVDQDTSFNLSFWIKLSGSNSNIAQFTFIGSGSPRYYCILQIYPASMNLSLIRGTNGWNLRLFDFPFNDGNWHHIYFTQYLYNATYYTMNTKIFVDGVVKYNQVASYSLYGQNGASQSSSNYSHVTLSANGAAIDDFLVNVGPPLWTEAFDPPTEAWPDPIPGTIYNGGNMCTDYTLGWYRQGLSDGTTPAVSSTVNVTTLDLAFLGTNNYGYSRYYISSNGSGAAPTWMTNYNKLHVRFKNTFTIPNGVYIGVAISANPCANDTNYTSSTNMHLSSYIVDEILTNQTITAGDVVTLNISSVSSGAYPILYIGSQNLGGSAFTASVDRIWMS